MHLLTHEGVTVPTNSEAQALSDACRSDDMMGTGTNLHSVHLRTSCQR